MHCGFLKTRLSLTDCLGEEARYARLNEFTAEFERHACPLYNEEKITQGPNAVFMRGQIRTA